MSVAIQADREGDRARLVPAGPFDLAHAAAVARAVGEAEVRLKGCRTVDVDLAAVDRIDGAGAVLLARLIDRLEARGLRTRLDRGSQPRGRPPDRALSRTRRRWRRPQHAQTMGPLTRLGVAAAGLPRKADRRARLHRSLRRRGAEGRRCPRARSIGARCRRLMQAIGADALPVTSAANLLVGLIIGFLGVSQLGRFGAVVYVPELVVVAQFRELGPLVTAIVVAGRSGAGLASELATMKVSEEIDALRSMGFDPVSWLVVPRCLALVVAVPLLTWIGDVLALVGGLRRHDRHHRHDAARLRARRPRTHITGAHFLGGLVKTPFLGAGHRAHRLRAGAGRARRRGGRRRAHHHAPSCWPSSA